MFTLVSDPPWGGKKKKTWKKMIDSLFLCGTAGWRGDLRSGPVAPPWQSNQQPPHTSVWRPPGARHLLHQWVFTTNCLDSQSLQRCFFSGSCESTFWIWSLQTLAVQWHHRFRQHFVFKADLKKRHLSIFASIRQFNTTINGLKCRPQTSAPPFWHIVISTK